MSWPTDGKPRFIVTELEAYPATWKRQAGTTVLQLSVSVLDRAYCYEEVACWRTDGTLGRGVGRAPAGRRQEIRRRAQALANQLNAEW
jgi:hypothetical protein